MDRSVPVWIAAALTLVVLIALPLGWLVSVSLGGGAGMTLAHYGAAFGDPALRKALGHTVVLAALGRPRVARHRRAARLAHRAHGPAGPARDPRAHPGLVRDAAVPRRLRVGDARGAECRLPQQALPERHRRGGGAAQHLQHDRARLRGHHVHVPVRLHHDRQHARPHRLGPRGGRGHPRRPAPGRRAHGDPAHGRARRRSAASSSPCSRPSRCSARRPSSRCPRAFTPSPPRSGRSSSTRRRSRWPPPSRCRCSSPPRCCCSCRRRCSAGGATPRWAARARRGD